MVAIGQHTFGNELIAALNVYVDRKRGKLSHLVALQEHGEVVAVLLAARGEAFAARAFAKDGEAEFHVSNHLLDL